MRHMFLLLAVICITVLAIPLFASDPIDQTYSDRSGPPLPTAFNYLPLVARNAFPLATPPGATATIIASPTATATATVTTTPTLTATPPGNLTLSGRVYDVVIGPTQPISGAIVSVTSCFPRTFSATSGAEGLYSLFMPAEYLNCVQVTLGVSAPD